MSAERSTVGDSERKPPSTVPRGAMRVKYWALIGVLVFLAFFFLFPRSEPLTYLYMGFFCFIALAAALYTCHEMWTLKAKRSSRWVGYVGTFGAAALIGALLVLHDLRVFRWNYLYLELPFGLYCAVTALGALLTERRKRVRVFAELEGLAFVRDEEPSNLLMQPTGQERPAAD